MARQTFEFHCPTSGGGCGKYFDIKLDLSTNGYYRVHCPNCEHIHYRSIKDGKITDERFTTRPDKDTPLIDDIYPMKSCCRDYQKETFLDIAPTAAGFSLGKISPNEAVALGTLREMVTEAEYRKYLRCGFIVVTGASGLKYQIFRDSWHIKVWDGGKLVEEICVRVKGVPPTDNLIAFKCIIEAGEDELRQMGNVYNLRKAA